MPRQVIDWLITDTHWYHNEIITLCNRPVNHLNLLIGSCRYCIAPQDRVFHLGDVIFYKLPELKGLMDSIPGKKFLIMGNHDSKSKGWYERNGFTFACEAMLVDDLYLTHKPVRTLPDGARLNIHGHWHNFEPTPERSYPSWYSTKTHRLLSIEKTKYKPVQLKLFGMPIPEKSIDPLHNIPSTESAL